MATLTKWIPTTDLLSLRRLGKLSEELGELQAAAARCIIQGIDEIDPASGIYNRQRLTNEMADVIAQCICTIKAFELDEQLIDGRINDKQRQMREWESMFKDDAS